jgi:hypothetical protein
MSLWSSSHRGRAGYVSDSDSGSDVDAGTHEARLMREMDLSGRHETVEYRPNPWSIARINAASRPLPKPGRSPPKPRPKPIVEAFKKQATLRDSVGAANRSRQGCDATEPLHVPSLAHTPQTGSTLRALEPKSAHIPTVSDQLVHAPPPFKPRRTFGTHRAARSSPVRRLAPVGDRPVFPHSSPGPRSHVAVSGKILSSGTIEVLLVPQRIPRGDRWYLHPRTWTGGPHTTSFVRPRYLVLRERRRHPVGYWMHSTPLFLWCLNLGKTLPILRIYGPRNRNASAWPRPNPHAKHHAWTSHRPPPPHRVVAPPTPLAKTTIRTPNGRPWRARSERCRRRRMWPNRAGRGTLGDSISRFVVLHGGRRRPR